MLNCQIVRDRLDDEPAIRGLCAPVSRDAPPPITGDRLVSKDMNQILSHIANCSSCSVYAERHFAMDDLAQRLLVEPSANFLQGVLARIGAGDTVGAIGSELPLVNEERALTSPLVTSSARDTMNHVLWGMLSDLRVLLCGVFTLFMVTSSSGITTEIREFPGSLPSVGSSSFRPGDFLREFNALVSLEATAFAWLAEITTFPPNWHSSVDTTFFNICYDFSFLENLPDNPMVPWCLLFSGLLTFGCAWTMFPCSTWEVAR